MFFSHAPQPGFLTKTWFSRFLADFKISPFLYRLGCGCLLNTGLHHKQQRVVRGYKSQKIESTYNSFLYYLGVIPFKSLICYHIYSNYSLDCLSSVGMLFLSLLRREEGSRAWWLVFPTLLSWSVGHIIQVLNEIFQ